MEVTHFIVDHHRNSHGSNLIDLKEMAIFRNFHNDNDLLTQCFCRTTSTSSSRPTTLATEATRTTCTSLMRRSWRSERSQTINFWSKSIIFLWKQLSIQKITNLSVEFAAINQFVAINQSIITISKQTFKLKSFKKVWSLSFLSQHHQSTESF